MPSEMLTSFTSDLAAELRFSHFRLGLNWERAAQRKQLLPRKQQIVFITRMSPSLNVGRHRNHDADEAFSGR
jgi:hypothetical protein